MPREESENPHSGALVGSSDRWDRWDPLNPLQTNPKHNPKP